MATNGTARVAIDTALHGNDHYSAAAALRDNLARRRRGGARSSGSERANCFQLGLRTRHRVIRSLGRRVYFCQTRLDTKRRIGNLAFTAGQDRVAHNFHEDSRDDASGSSGSATSIVEPDLATQEELSRQRLLELLKIIVDLLVPE